MTPTEASDLIRRFVSGNVGPWEWDDFISVKHKDPRVEAARQEAAETYEVYPATTPNHWCSEAGFQALLAIADGLEAEA